MADKAVQTLSEQEKTISLFEFIKELNKLKHKVVLNLRDYPWHVALSDIPVFPEYIKVCYRDRVEEESETAWTICCSPSASPSLRSARLPMTAFPTGWPPAGTTITGTRR